jgi:hypothetical protein
MSVVVFAGSSQFIHSYALCASSPHPFILRQDPPVSPKATTWPRFMSMQRLHSERTVAKE